MLLTATLDLTLVSSRALPAGKALSIRLEAVYQLPEICSPNSLGFRFKIPQNDKVLSHKKLFYFLQAKFVAIQHDYWL
jgi:hypothetical protein